MPDDAIIEQLELENKVLQANNKGLKGTIEELRNQNTELRDELEVKIAELNKIKVKIEELESIYKQEVNQKYNGNYYQQLKYAIQVLRELLEEE